MKSHTVHLTMNVPARMDLVNITGLRRRAKRVLVKVIGE
jgi:hypothetical protein